MTFSDNVQLDTSTTSGGGGGLAIGGGIGGVVLLLLGAVFGIDLGGITGSTGTSGPAPQDATAFAEQCKTGADANKYVECRIIGTENSANAYWQQTLANSQVDYQRPGLAIFDGATTSGCGPATSQTGPFYCPRDETMYFDASFFDVLTQRFGASNGALAQEYVVAHEVGHHVQNELGVLARAQRDPQGPESGAVRVELMADCFAGVWAQHASTTTDASGTPFLKTLTPQDINDALSAAAAVGDDRIQKAATGSVQPHTFTHGTSAQRQEWFLRGYSTGQPNQCDTLSATEL